MAKLPQPLVRVQLRQVTRALRRDVFAALPSEAQLECLELRPVVAEDPKAGSRPQRTLVDESGRRYMFKLAPPDFVAAELFVHRLRELGGCLHVPTARRTLELSDLGRVTGMLQPQIPVAGALDPAPTRWTSLQREAMLRDHPWEWLVANLDTHIDQYVLVGEAELPLNIDWDHALVDLDQTELTRFSRRSVTVAPIRNLLYSEYVLGQVSLDFFGMQLQARKLARIPDAAVVELLDRHADELDLPALRRAEIRDRVLRRKASLVADFDRLVEALRDEREHQLAGVGARGWQLRWAVHEARDAWQRFAIVVLHARVLRPALLGYRSMLGRLARRGRKP